MAVGILRDSGENLSDTTPDLRLISSPEEQKARIKELAAAMGSLAAELRDFPQDVVAEAYSESIVAARANSDDKVACMGRDVLNGMLPEPIADEILLSVYREPAVA